MTKEELREKIAQEIYEGYTGLPWQCMEGEEYKHTKEAVYKHTDSILTLIRESGLFMDVEMVKGLMFEAQAKKCASCPKNKEPT